MSGGDSQKQGCCTDLMTKQCHRAPPGASWVIEVLPSSGRRGQGFQVPQSLLLKSLFLGLIFSWRRLGGDGGHGPVVRGLQIRLVLSNRALSHQAVRGGSGLNYPYPRSHQDLYAICLYSETSLVTCFDLIFKQLLSNIQSRSNSGVIF